MECLESRENLNDNLEPFWSDGTRRHGSVQCAKVRRLPFFALSVDRAGKGYVCLVHRQVRANDSLPAPSRLLLVPGVLDFLVSPCHPLVPAALSGFC